MQATQIQIAYVNLPKTENGPGSIKDSNGVYWTLWKDQLPNFIGREGQVVTINYETKMYRGKAQPTIIGLAGGQGPQLAPAQQAQQAPSAPVPAGGFIQIPGAPATSSPAGFINPAEKDENIAVLALVKEWMGKIPVGDAAGVTHALNSVWIGWRMHKRFRKEHDAKTHAAPPVPPPNPRLPLRQELNDEIPDFDEPGKSIDETF